MVAYQNIYDSLADFISTMDSEKVLGFKAPESLQKKVDQLIYKKKIDSILTNREQEEIDHYFILEHIVRLAKTRTLLRISKK